MKKLFSLIVLLILNSTYAEELIDVRVLDTNLSKDGIELKLQKKGPSKNSYFFVDITKDDKDAFKKIGLVMKKIAKGSSFKLNLDIKSFSFSPSGSYYRSKHVIFSKNPKR